MPSKFIGVLCFIFNSRHGMLLLCLHALREEESSASNEATVVLVVTQPVPELGEDLGRVLQHFCTHPCVTCVMPPCPGPKLLKTKMSKCVHLKLKHQAPLEQDMSLGAFLSWLSLHWSGCALGVLSTRHLSRSGVLQPCFDAPQHYHQGWHLIHG